MLVVRARVALPLLNRNTRTRDDLPSAHLAVEINCDSDAAFLATPLRMNARITDSSFTSALHYIFRAHERCP